MRGKVTDIPDGWFNRRGKIDITYDQKLLAEKGVIIPVSVKTGEALAGVTNVSLNSTVHGLSALTVTFFIDSPYVEKPDEDAAETDAANRGD